MKKTIYTIAILLVTQFSFLHAELCPDPPGNDDPCITSDRPPIDLTITGNHFGTTCCATEDFENVDCNQVSNASVWYMYTPNPSDKGITIFLEAEGSDPSEGPLAVEVYVGAPNQGCNGGFDEAIISSCVDTDVFFKIGNCFESGEVLFIKVSTGESEENCGDFVIIIGDESDNVSADDCFDLGAQTPIEPTTDSVFIIDYVCVSGSLDYACPESDNLGGCSAFQELPTVWFEINTDENANQMFSTVETDGTWNAVWSVYSGPDCDNLSLVTIGGAVPCSNDDNTPDLHQTPILNDESKYWIMVTADPNSLPPSGIGDASFNLCVSTTINAIICIGDLEGSCDDESLLMQITDRDSDDLPLDGPFCQGEEVTINISFFYDASESGADWLIGFVPKFGAGWDMENFDFDAHAPIANGQTGQWYAEGTELAPIIQEPVPILCTYRDEDGVLQICNQLCAPCLECEQQGMQEGDPLPSGYFWVSNGGNAGCANDGSPGEGWGIGSIQAQIDWTFTLRVKTFESEDDCLAKNDLSISFQTFSDGVAGCWEDPIGECLLDRAMVSPAWRIGCNEVPPGILAEDMAICTKSLADITVNTDDGSNLTIVVEALDNPFVTGGKDYIFEEGFGVISDFLVNTNTGDEIFQYDVYVVDSTLECRGPKRTVEVIVYSQYINDLQEAACVCENGCATIGIDATAGSTYLWSSGETSSMITVCPTTPTNYALTTTDANGCEHYGSVIVDCEGVIEECLEPVYYKLVYDFYRDINANGVRDTLESSFGEGIFFLEPDHTLIYNTGDNKDTLLLEEGEYSLVYTPYILECWTLSTDSIVTVMLDSAQNCVNVEFGLAPKEPKRDIFLTHYLAPRCNSDRFFHLVAENEGTQVESGILWATLDENVLPNEFPTGATIDTFIAPNLVGWFFEDLYPGSTISKTVKVHIPGPPDFAIGGILSHTIYSELDNANGTTEIWGERTVNGIVRCAYDPNDKAVDPSHEEGYTDIDQDVLVFKIRFQNTGNAPAENIQIRDTLSEFLDVLSVEYIRGSHDEYLTFSRVEDRVFLFTFNNINLPDSTADFEGSQGFLLYKVAINDALPEGTVIENTAHIYFDNNPAIVTNTTKNILYPDMDNDGYFSIEDCNEEDAAINPGAEEIPNNAVDEDCDGVALIIDNDMDGFNSDEDCDDENAAINPDAEEIINNDVDENCDNLVVIIDIDMDGFNSDEDCDDENADINPDADEIPNNELDEDCDGEALIIDNDMDGFNSDEDCDDDNADINSDAEEIPNNEVDEDCDGEALIIDNDMDGFNSDEDCDDENADINPDADEIPNNELDEDCDGEALIIDNDMDGFNSDEDCDDDNADINPDAIDIPGNGIDEDCDGMDAVIIGVEEELLYKVSITPNPSNDAFNITLNTTEEVNYIIRDVVGREVVRGKIAPSNRTVYLGMEPNGIYLMVLSSEKLRQVSFHKLLKI